MHGDYIRNMVRTLIPKYHVSIHPTYYDTRNIDIVRWLFHGER